MGIRMISLWKPPASLLRPSAAASDPNPTAVLIPPKAMTAVHALCNKMKSRLVKLTTHIREFAATDGGESCFSEILFMRFVVFLVAIRAAG
jgi:hypothetical protein